MSSFPLVIDRLGAASERRPSGDVERDIRAFVGYARTCGDEKGDVHGFCDRLFRAFGHAGYREAGAVLEERVRTEYGEARFADLAWMPRVLIEVKKRGEKLARHYAHAMQYWLRLTPDRPRFVVLCNFEEFWICDFNAQLDEPMDRLTLGDLPERSTALSFMLREGRAPILRNDRAVITDVAATKMGDLFRALVERGEARERAQRFTLQCVVAMFSEHAGLLPPGLFTERVFECMKGASSRHLLGSLFAKMNRSPGARGGRSKGARYPGGGILSQVDPIELRGGELAMLYGACGENWSRINPGIFGTLFQESMEGAERHRSGAHYTPEAEIMRVVLPTLVQPWQARIRGADSVEQLLQIRGELARVRVLDPACGSGNFLYVAYRELQRLDLRIVERVHDESSEPSRLKAGAATTIRTTQFFGIDSDPFAVELAKVTLVFAKKLAFDEAHHALEDTRPGLDCDVPPPPEDLDDNIRCDDALFCAWPRADVIIGNPPFQSKNKAQGEMRPGYMRRVRARYPDVPGRADYCVYWFRRAHDELAAGARAGLVGTNTIRQNYSRIGGLDHIVASGGTISEAVSSQVWPGRAVVHVSIANWVKGEAQGPFRLATQIGDKVDSPWREEWLGRIPSSLSGAFDVSTAASIGASARSSACFQGQTHGHKGFVLSRAEAARALTARPSNREVIFPYLAGDEMVGGIEGDPWRYVIDFHPRDQVSARNYKEPFDRVRAMVLPDREEAAERERVRERQILSDDPDADVNHHHANFLSRWWALSYPRGELMTLLAGASRYIACSRVTKRPIFVFASSKIHPNDALTVFPIADDYSFGILQSGIHWAWFTGRCSTLKGDPRYTSNTVFDSFAWPQSPTRARVAEVAGAAVALRATRRRLMADHGVSLRDLYAQLDDPGEHPLRLAHERLDGAVRASYGVGKGEDPLPFLLELNRWCRAQEETNLPVTGPGLPRGHRPGAFVTDDCLEPPVLG